MTLRDDWNLASNELARGMDQIRGKLVEAAIGIVRDKLEPRNTVVGKRLLYGVDYITQRRILEGITRTAGTGDDPDGAGARWGDNDPLRFCQSLCQQINLFALKLVCRDHRGVPIIVAPCLFGRGLHIR